MTKLVPPRRFSQLPLHPLLWIAFPVLALWNENRRETAPNTVLEVLLPALLVAFVILAVFSLLMRDIRRGALAAVIVLVPSTLYGYVFDESTGQLPLVVWVLILGAGLAAVRRVSEETLVQLTASLNVVSLLLVLINGVPAVLGALDRQAALAAQPAIDLSLDEDSELPDIWYLVPDRFGRSDTLASTYGIDNAAFVGGLRDLGFQVFDQAATNYPQSLASITAALNLNYLEDPSDPRDRTSTELALFDDHLVGQLTERAGYEYLHLGNWADFSQSAVRADRVLTTREASAFGTKFLDLTVVRALESLIGRDAGDGQLTGAYQLQQIHTQHQLAVLDELVEERPADPQFVFTHLILPHEPFIYDADGSSMNEQDVARIGWTEAYGRQLRFTQDRLTSIVSRLLARDRPPIIVIQADEGPLPEWFYERGDEPFATLTEEETRLHNSILSAVFVPDGTLPLREDEPVTSINIMRAVIAEAFGIELERLQDRSFTFETAWHSPYADVTDLVFSDDRRGPDGG